MSPASRMARPDKALPSSTPIQNFPYFSQLPPELRLKIWEYNLPPPRIVSVRCGAKSPSSLPPPRRGSKPKTPGYCSPCSWSPSPKLASPPSWCTSPAPIPVNLHVCHESRVEALRHYALMFGIARQPGHVFFDPAHDVLYFGPRDGFMAAEAQLRTMLALADPNELAQVQRVALAAAVLGDVFSSSGSPASTNLTVDVLHLLRTKLPYLRELIVVPHDENPVYSRDAMLVPLPLPVTSLPLAPVSAWPTPPTEELAACTAAPSGPATAAATAAATDTTTTENTSRLTRQVHTAMRRVCAIVPDWTPPRWRILVITSGPRPKRDESESEGEEDEDEGDEEEELEERQVRATKYHHRQLGKRMDERTNKAPCCCDCRMTSTRASPRCGVARN